MNVKRELSKPKTLRSLVRTAERFARREPAFFIGLAFVLGLFSGRAQARPRPLSFALVGAGLGWLLLTRPSDGARRLRRRRATRARLGVVELRRLRTKRSSEGSLISPL